MTVDSQDTLDAIAAQLCREFTLVTDVTAYTFTDSTGDDAVRFEVTLTDPPGGREVGYSDVAPLEARIAELAGPLGLLVHTRYQLSSDAREIAAGTYYG